MNFEYKEEYFSGLTSNWNRVSYKFIGNLIDGAIKEKHGMKILDLGCGTGTYFFDLKNKNNLVFGILTIQALLLMRLRTKVMLN